MGFDWHREQWPWMISNTKIGVLMDFWRFWAARHISRAKCAEITRDRPWQPAYEIFSIKRQFERSMSWPLRSRKPVHESIKEGCPLKCALSAARATALTAAARNRYRHLAYVTDWMKIIVSNAGIVEFRFCSHWAFKHVLLSHVPLCVSWALLYSVAYSPVRSFDWCK